MTAKETIKEFVKKNSEDMEKIFMDLCYIPAPSHHEEKRAAYCKQKLEEMGAEGVIIDDALNVVYPINCEGSNQLTVFVAHTDTVFPDMEPMQFTDDGKIVRGPGCGDDTASVAVLLETVRFYIEQKLKPEHGVLFVCNSCEEGLGNLKGTRQIFKDYEGRIARFVSFDSKLGYGAKMCVGSHRYEVEVQTPGGHSFGKFGNKNAIAELAKMVAAIYQIEVPKVEGSKTTYNVGTIEGGTSVNTIAQNAKMLCEYRSDNAKCLAYMEQQFDRIFREAQAEDVKVIVNRVGNRPCCGDVDLNEVKKLEMICTEAIDEVAGKKAVFGMSSTDCNIPLSLGIPAICVGVYTGEGAHTREEWVDKTSLPTGLELAITLSERLMV